MENDRELFKAEALDNAYKRYSADVNKINILYGDGFDLGYTIGRTDKEVEYFNFLEGLVAAHTRAYGPHAGLSFRKSLERTIELMNEYDKGGDGFGNFPVKGEN